MLLMHSAQDIRLKDLFTEYIANQYLQANQIVFAHLSFKRIISRWSKVSVQLFGQEIKKKKLTEIFNLGSIHNHKVLG